MAIIDLVRWAPQDGETIFAWRFPHTNLSTYTQLIVQESQEAVLFSKGQIMGKFGPGKHTLNTENLPVLRSLFGIPFGGRNPFTAEVWFVNRIQTFSIDWSIDRMAIHDADYNTQLPLTASGQYGLVVSDAEKFLVKIVGTRSEFTQDDLTEQFTGESPPAQKERGCRSFERRPRQNLRLPATGPRNPRPEPPERDRPASAEPDRTRQPRPANRHNRNKGTTSSGNRPDLR